MQENNFEKNIQERFNDWRLSPSDEVWTAVEERIRKRRRRFAALWVPLAVLLLAGGIYLYQAEPAGKAGNLTQGSNPKILKENSGPATPTTNNTATATESSPSQKSLDERTEVTADRQDRRSNETTPSNRALSGISSPQHSARPKSGKSAKSAEVIAKTNASPELSKSATSTENTDLSKVLVSTNTPLKVEEHIGSPANKAASAPENSTLEGNTGAVDNLFPITAEDIPHQFAAAGYSDFEKEQLSAVLKSNSYENCCSVPALPGDITSGQKKIRYGIDAGIGFSKFGNQLKGLGQLKSAAADFNAAPSSANNLIMSRASNAVFTRPVQSVPGIGFYAGGFAEKPLGKKWALNAGLRYSYFSDRMTVGNVQSSSLNFVYFSSTNGTPIYQGNDAQNYTNKYHFISLPLELRFNVIHIGNTNLQLNAGVEYGRLIQTNAISFQTSNAGYYVQNKSTLNQNQFFANTGLSTAFPLSGRLISLGVEYRFGLNELRTAADDLNRSLHYTGLRIRYYLK